MDIKCSKGTYIRSLVSDIGEILGCGAVMTSLRRTLANGFSIEDALTEEAIKEKGETAVLPIDTPFFCYPALTVSPAQAKRFSNGGDLLCERLHSELKPSFYRVYAPGNRFLGLGEVESSDLLNLKAKRVIGHD